METKPCCGSNGHRHKKDCISQTISPGQTMPTETTEVSSSEKETNDLSALMQRFAELEKKDAEKQKTIDMLLAVADKGRVFNYENKESGNRGRKVRLSIYNGKVVVGWKTLKDDFIYDPRTGAQVGETQQYEILLHGDDGVTKELINGYGNFSNIRYEKRVECNVLSQKTDYQGNITFEVQLPDGKSIDLNPAFLN